MKPVNILLGISLLGTLVLAIATWRSFTAPDVPKTRAESAAVVVSEGGVKQEADDMAAVLRADPELAEAIKSGDPYRLRDALTRAGFPPDYVRDMVTFHINNSVTPEHLALLEAQSKMPSWQTAPAEEIRKLQKYIADRDAKNTALAKDVFGGKVPPHPLAALMEQRRYSFLPEGKIESVARIDSDYSELEMENRRSGNSAEARERAQLLQKEKRADLAKLLTP